MLRFDDLPPSLQQQAEIYAEAALAYAAGRRALTAGYAIVGYGNYRTGARRWRARRTMVSSRRASAAT